MNVIGTAGHVDHGKSALVSRLTGTDPDRLPEEKRRGMTIELGFAQLRLKSGKTASIVDVPGHERFVGTMLAGAGGVDIALLVVSSEEGVMPQTREHVNILSLLGVSEAVVALTKADLVDDEWLRMVASDVEDLLKPTRLSSAPVIPVSVVTGEGIDALLHTLSDCLDSAPARSAAFTPFLPIDRVFTMAGFGTVVTGTLQGAPLAVGDEVSVLPRGLQARVRSLQIHGEDTKAASPGNRVAVNISGVSVDDLARGDVLALPGEVSTPHRFDAHLQVLPGAPFPLRHGSQISLFIGAAERQARLSTLGNDELKPGESGWVQVRLASPVPALLHQRFIVRLPDPAGTVAGGQIVDANPRHRRRDVGAIRRLNALLSDSSETRVCAVLSDGNPRRVSDLLKEAGLPGGATAIVNALVEDQRLGRLDDMVLLPETWQGMLDQAQSVLSAYHRRFPLRVGMPRQELKSKLGWPDTVWSAALRACEQSGLIRTSGAYVALKNHRSGLADKSGEVDAVLAALREKPFAPPSGSNLVATHGADLLGAMVAEGLAVRVSDDLYFAADAYRHMRIETVRLIQADGYATVAKIRDTLGTSRKCALAFLEHLDSCQVTRRNGDVRTLGPRAEACA